MEFAVIALAFSIIVAFMLFFGAFVIVKQGHCALITRLGSYHQTLGPGLHIIIPFVDTVDRVLDLREQVLPLQSQSVITRDNVVINIDAVVYYQIINPYAAIYEISNLLFAIEQLALTSLRNIVGEMTLDETLVGRDMINTKLQQIIDLAASKWGVKTNRIELKDIDPPADIQRAMNMQMEAERNKRATILQAEGEREAAILRADGEEQAIVKRAEAHAQKLRLEVEAEALTTKIYIEKLKEADPTEASLQLVYMETLKKLANGDANKIFLPIDTLHTISAIGAIGAGLKEKK